MTKPFEKQVDGNHYAKLAMQPVPLTYLIAGGDACFLSVAKYLLRDKCDVNGKPLRPIDLNKAVHFVELGEISINGTLRDQQYKKVNEHDALKAIKTYAEQWQGEYGNIIEVALYFMWIGSYKEAIEQIRILAEYENIELA